MAIYFNCELLSLIEKVLDNQLTPHFEYTISNDKLDSRAELYPHSMRLLSLFNDTLTSNIFLIRTDDSFDCTATIKDMCGSLSIKRAKTLCYLLNSRDEISTYELWLDKAEDLANQVNELLKHSISTTIESTFFVDAKESIRFNEQLTTRKSDIAEHVFSFVKKELNPIQFIDGMCTDDNLFGSILANYHDNSYQSDIRHIKSGYIHKAHGSYLAVKISQLLESPTLWHKLKQACVSNRSHLSSKYPSAIKLIDNTCDFRLILVGDSQQISALSSFDSELSNNIDNFAEIKSEFNVTLQSATLYINYINTIISENELLPLSQCGLNALVLISSRWCEHQNYLSLDEPRLKQTLTFADSLAREANLDKITQLTLAESLHLQHLAISSHVSTSNEDITTKQVVFNMTGKSIGQVNGLSVLELPAHPEGFGEPIRITATAHLQGDGEISDVERKADLAGNIHAKSMMIIQGFLTHVFANPHPLPLHANIVFEQSYGEIDGDSASLAVTTAVLSALSKKPVRQDIGVTGAIDQFGNILAVGGVNEKIEAFYRVCQLQGQDAGAVLIPRANCINLNLSQAVQEAILAQKFTIYTAATVEQALSLLIGEPAMPLDNETSIFGHIQHQVDNLEEQDEDENLFVKLSSKFVNLFNIQQKDN